MRTGRIQIDDVVEVRIKGRSIVGRVTEVHNGVVYFNPICPGAGWRHAKARDIVAHWRKTGRRDGGEEDSSEGEQPVAIDGQLSLEHASE